MELARIILPHPHRSLHPNSPVFSRGGRINKAKQAKQCRKLSKEAIEELMLDTTPWPCVSVVYDWYFTIKRDRDDDNYIAACKAYRDGIVDAGLVLDDNSLMWRTAGCFFHVGAKETKRLEITLTRCESL